MIYSLQNIFTHIMSPIWTFSLNFKPPNYKPLKYNVVYTNLCSICLFPASSSSRKPSLLISIHHPYTVKERCPSSVICVLATLLTRQCIFEGGTRINSL